MPASAAAQPLPTTTLPPGTVGWLLDNRLTAPQATPAGIVNTSWVAVRDTIVAATPRTVTPATSPRPLPAIVTSAPAVATRYTAEPSTRIAGTTVSGAADAIWSPALPSTCTTPDCAASGTVTVIRVEPLRVAIGAEAPPENITAVARSRFVPLIVSVCPATTDNGSNDVNVIGATTVICCDCGRLVPSLSISVTVPLVAACGTSTTRAVAVCDAIGSTVEFTRTCTTRSRFEPVRVTRPPGRTAVGDSAVTWGTPLTVKSSADRTVRPAAVSSMRPVCAPAGTTSASCVSDATVKDAAVAPIRADCSPAKPAPVTVIVVPAPPAVGTKPAIASVDAAGAGATLDAAVPPPSPPPPQAASVATPAITSRCRARRARAVKVLRMVMSAVCFGRPAPCASSHRAAERPSLRLVRP